MSNFTFEKDVKSALAMDSPVQGPQMRWQRKMRDNSNMSCNESLINTTVNMSMTGNGGVATAKTPSKRFALGNLSSKTPTTKTPNKLTKTPGKGKSPSRGGDRFIPNRSSTQFELGHHLISRANYHNEDEEMLSPTKREFQQAMRQNLNGDRSHAKIMSYQSKPAQAPEGFQNNLKVLYSTSKTPAAMRKTIRHIPQVPERILDAPEILDDYYLKLIDWSSTNQLAVCLSGHVYLWNAGTGDINQLMEMDSQEDYVSSVSWVKEGNFLAIGTSTATVQLWDVTAMKRLRVMGGHASRVGALSWNDHILSSGSRTGAIHHHDVRIANHHIGTMHGHTQEVCGLQWSPDKRFLASGGNDNQLHIWGNDTGSSYTEANTVHTFSHHQAAVKAVAWCPWQASLLATGGGTADRHIRFWNVNNGTQLNSVDTKSQVCCILWSPEHKELITGHGFSQNQLCIWKYPSMKKIAELMGHQQRVLHMAMSPDRQIVVSAAADETLRLWKCFAVDEQKKKQASKVSSSHTITGSLCSNIR